VASQIHGWRSSVTSVEQGASDGLDCIDCVPHVDEAREEGSETEAQYVGRSMVRDHSMIASERGAHVARTWMAERNV
jgi:hypothetical protein